MENVGGCHAEVFPPSVNKVLVCVVHDEPCPCPARELSRSLNLRFVQKHTCSQNKLMVSAKGEVLQHEYKADMHFVLYSTARSTLGSLVQDDRGELHRYLLGCKD